MELELVAAPPEVVADSEAEELAVPVTTKVVPECVLTALERRESELEIS